MLPQKLTETFSPSFKNRPLEERPRERLSFLGERELTDEELVALVLGSGATIPVARILLDQAGGMSGLRKIGFAELCRLPKIGKARACQLKAAMELGRRAQLPEPLQGYQIRSPQEIAHLLQTEFAHAEQESFYVFGLDARYRIRFRTIAAIGQIDRVHVASADIFRPLVREGMAAVLVAHNHPSGDPSPSPEDATLTTNLNEAGKLLGIPLLDHIVVASNGYYSFSEDQKL